MLLLSWIENKNCARVYIARVKSNSSSVRCCTQAKVLGTRVAAAEYIYIHIHIDRLESRALPELPEITRVNVSLLLLAR